MEKKLWYLWIGTLAALLILFIVFLLRKPTTIIQKDDKAIQEARMQQFKGDSIKYTRIMSAMATDRNRIDSLYALKERNNEILWKKLQEALGVIVTYAPDSINVIFARDTENPPSW